MGCNIILGLKTMRENDLTTRYPSIFMSEAKQDELLCNVCDLNDSEGGGNQAIRTLSYAS